MIATLQLSHNHTFYILKWQPSWPEKNVSNFAVVAGKNLNSCDCPIRVF